MSDWHWESWKGAMRIHTTSLIFKRNTNEISHQLTALFFLLSSSSFSCIQRTGLKNWIFVSNVITNHTQNIYRLLWESLFHFDLTDLIFFFSSQPLRFYFSRHFHMFCLKLCFAFDKLINIVSCLKLYAMSCFANGLYWKEKEKSEEETHRISSTPLK